MAFCQLMHIFMKGLLDRQRISYQYRIRRRPVSRSRVVLLSTSAGGFFHLFCFLLVPNSVRPSAIQVLHQVQLNSSSIHCSSFSFPAWHRTSYIFCDALIPILARIFSPSARLYVPTTTSMPEGE